MDSLALTPKPIAEPKTVKPKINYDLEALRGFAALFVVFGHLSYYKDVFNKDYFPDLLYAFEPDGHFCVLIFFVLSGYVIGISHKSPLNNATIKSYLMKRFVRIYPIYFVSILFALLVSTSPYSVGAILGNLSLLQGVFVKVIFENNPAWSLNYEVLYYLMFIPLSFSKLDPRKVLLFSFVSSLLLSFLYRGGYVHISIALLSSYIMGFSFWLIGLCIARYLQKPSKINYNLMLSNVFLLLATNYYHPLVSIFYKLTKGVSFPSGIYWYDIGYLPFCFIFIMNFVSKEYRYKRLIMFLFQIVPVFSLAVYLMHPKKEELGRVLLSSIFYSISLLLFFLRSGYIEKWSHKVISLCIPLGGISYGLYIIHFPVLVLFGKGNSWSASNLYQYSGKLICYLAFLFLSTYLLEKVYQNKIKALLLDRPPKAA